MIFTETPIGWAILIIISSVLSLYISGYAFHRKHVHGASALSFFAFSVALYSLGYALEINSHSLPQIMDALKFEVFWASFTAPAFLLFVVEFIKHQKTPTWSYITLFTIPLTIDLLALTNDQHTLLYQKYWLEQGEYFPIIKYQPGPAYVLELVFLILVSFLAELLLFVHLFRCSGTTRTKTLLVLIGGVLPTLSAMANPDRTTFSGLDLQPFVFVITGILLAIALFYFKMLDLRKIAREYAVDAIHDYLLIVDKNKFIVDINQAGKSSHLLQHFSAGSPLPTDNEFTTSIMRHLSTIEDEPHGKRYSIQVDDKHYQYSITPIQDSFRHIQGYVLLVNDYTQMANLLADMEVLAIKDSLTDIFNRRQLFHLAKRELEIATRNGASVSVILFDLDDFKNINDRFGHLVGDTVLKEIANVVQHQLRISEIFGRYGGEEFCIFCPNTDGQEAMLIAERLRHSIEVIDWQEHGVPILTASFGVCTSKPSGTNKTLEGLLSVADTALYKAKSAGKNTAVFMAED